MPFRGILNTARTLSYYARVQQVVANNLANASTDGFKVDRMTAFLGSGTSAPVPVQVTDFRQGTLSETGRPLDISLEGAGFFVVQTEQGERLIRGGTLKLDAAGQLTDALGAPVLGKEGPLVILGGAVEVAPDGALSVDGALVDKLRVENVEDPTTLLKEEFGRFATTTETSAVEDGMTKIRQGFVEDANGDALTSMLDLLRIQRAYAANLNALKTMDSALGSITSDIGSLR